VPFTPLISVAACVYLMSQLPSVTWKRFGYWLLAGLVIYFFYSQRHSRLGLRDKAAAK
jgi:APA family basic amino acid/polyamine antiporter